MCLFRRVSTIGKAKRYLFVSISLLLALSFAFPLQNSAGDSANDWPVFRHDKEHSGFSDSNAPTTLAASLWNYTFEANPLSVPSCPAVVEGRVYAVFADHVYCLNARNGAVIWSFKTGNLADSSPAVSNGRVYVSSANGTVYCLNTADSELIWSSSVGESVSSPVNFADGRVYVESMEGNLFCLSAADGKRVWNSSTGAEALQACPAVSGNYVFAANDDGSVLCLSASDGTKVWNFTADGAVGSPAVADGFVFFGSKDGNAYCLKASSGMRVWNYTTWYNYAGPSHGYHWGNTVSDPAVSKGRVYVGSSDFDVFCLDGSTGEKIWNFTTGAEVYASPSVADDCVFVGSYDGNLYCLNASSGKENWCYAAGIFSPTNAAGSVGSPAIDDGAVYVIGNGVLTALGPSSAAFPIVEVVGTMAVLILVVGIAAYFLARSRKKLRATLHSRNRKLNASVRAQEVSNFQRHSAQLQPRLDGYAYFG